MHLWLYHNNYSNIIIDICVGVVTICAGVNLSLAVRVDPAGSLDVHIPVHEVEQQTSQVHEDLCYHHQ